MSETVRFPFFTVHWYVPESCLVKFVRVSFEGGLDDVTMIGTPSFVQEKLSSCSPKALQVRFMVELEYTPVEVVCVFGLAVILHFRPSVLAAA